MPDLTLGRYRGGHCVTWHDSDGRRRRFQLYAGTEEARRAEAIAVYRRETTSTSGITVRSLWDDYRAEKAGRPATETMRHTGKAVLGFFGDLHPFDITPDHCARYREDRASASIKTGSIHTELGHLRTVMNWASKRHRISHAPHIELPPKPDSAVTPLSDGEISRLIDACDTPHLRLAVVLALTTAARAGAILDLTWDRVDFDRGVINLRLGDGEKRKGRAVLPMNATNRAALSAARAVALTGHVIEWNGKPVKSIKTAFGKARDRAVLDNLRFHDLRHTAAVTMLVGGMRIEMVAQVLGHSTPQVTFKTYARFLPAHLAPAVDLLELPAVRSSGSVNL